MTDSEAGARSVFLIEDEKAHAELVRGRFEKDGSEWAIHCVARFLIPRCRG